MEDRSEHFVGKVAQKAIIERDGKILVCKGIGDKVWELPGGRLHNGEKPQEGLAREIKEEVNLEISVGKPVFIDKSYHGKEKADQLFVTYACTVIGGEFKADPGEVEDYCWVAQKEALALPLFEDCRAALRAYFGVR